MKTNKILIAIIICFFIKTLILSFSITPLWDIPDEPGHFAYIQDIAHGRGIPVLGEATISPEIVVTWHTKAEAPERVMNWIAQHPPGYYLLGALILTVAEWFTDDPYWLYRAPRILSSMSAAISLYVFFLIFLLTSRNEMFSIVTTTAISVLPMYTHMSSGTSHDTFLTLMAALAILYLFKYLLGSNYRDALIMAAFLSLAGFTKITALAMTFPMLVVLFCYIKGKPFTRIYRAILAGLISLILPGLWLLRNWIIFREPLMDATYYDLDKGIQASVSLLSFLQTNPVFDHTFKNFIALIGWTGTGGGKLSWFQVGENILIIYSMALLCCIILSYFVHHKYLLNTKSQLSNILSFTIIVLTIFLYIIFFIDKPYPFYRQILYTLFLGTLLFSFLWFWPQVAKDKVIIYSSLFIIAFYLIIYILKLKNLFEIYGVMRATHGRYIFPLIPYLTISYIYPAFRLLRSPNWLLFILISILLVTELLFFVTSVMPFYLGGYF